MGAVTGLLHSQRIEQLESRIRELEAEVEGMRPVVEAAQVLALANDVYLTDVLLLCVTCRQPIKARVNTPNWLRVEWISPGGECLGCHQKGKESGLGGPDGPDGPERS